MRAHHLAGILLAGPNHHVTITLDDATVARFEEEGTGAWEMDETEPVGVATIDTPLVKAVSITVATIADDEPEHDDRTRLEAFQEDHEDEILDDIATGVRDHRGRLNPED